MTFNDRELYGSSASFFGVKAEPLGMSFGKTLDTPTSSRSRATKHCIKNVALKVPRCSLLFTLDSVS